jgi:transposase
LPKFFCGHSSAWSRLDEELQHYRSYQPPVSEFVSRLIQECLPEFWLRVRKSMGLAKPARRRRRPSTKRTVRLRLDALIKLNTEMQQHYWGFKSPVSDGILAYFHTRMTSAAIEAIDGTIQLAKRMARGFKSFVYFRTAAYHRAGKLTLAVPTIA